MMKYSVSCVVSQVTYRVIQVSDGQLEGQADGAAAVSLVTGFPATTQTVTQVEDWPKTTTNLFQLPSHSFHIFLKSVAATKNLL